MNNPKMDPKSSVEEVGGKAFILIKLKDLKFNIPEFIVLDKSELLKHVSEEKLANKTATELQRTIEDIELKDELLKHINKSFDNASDKTFAVRSSAVNEDGGEFSFAGQYESYLYVKLEDVPKFVKKVWCSNFSERVIAYHKSNNIERQNGIAVINSPGTIDSDYRGEIGVLLVNLSNELFEINNGDRIAQMVLAKYEPLDFIEVSEISISERGEKGFGSTGNK